MPRVRVIIPVKFYVSYILDLEEPTIEGLRKAIESGSFDPSGWESDPDFYENLWDAIKNAVYKGGEVKIEEVGDLRPCEVRIQELIPDGLYHLHCPICHRFLILHSRPKLDEPLICHHSDRPELDWRRKIREGVGR